MQILSTTVDILSSKINVTLIDEHQLPQNIVVPIEVLKKFMCNDTQYMVCQMTLVNPDGVSQHISTKRLFNDWFLHDFEDDKDVIFEQLFKSAFYQNYSINTLQTN